MNAPALYRTFNSNICKENCIICLESLESEPAVAHEGVGHLHPLHRECAKKVHSTIIPDFTKTCPTCRMPINRDFLFTWKDRCVLDLRHITRDARVGALSGLAIAAGLVVLVAAKELSPLVVALAAAVTLAVVARTELGAVPIIVEEEEGAAVINGILGGVAVIHGIPGGAAVIHGILGGAVPASLAILLEAAVAGGGVRTMAQVVGVGVGGGGGAVIGGLICRRLGIYY